MRGRRVGGRRRLGRWLRVLAAVASGTVLVACVAVAFTVVVRVHDGQPPDPTSVGDDAAWDAITRDVRLPDTAAVVSYCSAVAARADQEYQQTLTDYGDSVDVGCVSTLVSDLDL